MEEARKWEAREARLVRQLERLEKATAGGTLAATRQEPDHKTTLPAATTPGEPVLPSVSTGVTAT